MGDPPIRREGGSPPGHGGRPLLFRRLTLIVSGGTIEHVFYPVFPPLLSAQPVLDWLKAN